MRDRLLRGLYQLMDSFLGAVLGGLCYGLWAFAVNLPSGLPHALLIGGAHWTMSVFLTWYSVSLMRTLFWLPRDRHAGAVLAAAGSLTLTYTLLISVHRALGNPHILMTLAPGFLPTLGFVVVYTSLLLRETRDPAWTLALARRDAHKPAEGARHARA